MDVSKTDPWLARLFELADAIHDLDREDDPEMRRFLQESVGAQLPSKPALTLDDVKDKTTFIKRITGAAEIVFAFDDGTIHRVSPNPMKGRNLEGGKMKSGTGFASTKTDDIATADIYFKRTFNLGPKRVAVINDLVELRKVMDEAFTNTKTKFCLSKNACLSVMIDQDMHPDTRRAHCQLLAWMIGFKTLLSTIQHKFEKAGGRPLDTADEAAIKATTNLEFVYCDASLMDGGKTKGMTPSLKDTGQVYHKDSEIRFEFVGPNETNQYGYKAFTTVPQYNPLDENDLTKDALHRVVTDGLYEDVLTYESGTEPVTDKQIVFKQAKKWKDKKKHVAYLAARVRAGDWGQIEHCKKNNVVFVTADQLSALYATYRGVGVMLVRHDDRIQRDAKATFVHYRFCFGMPRQPAQTAGARSAHGPYCLLLSCVTVAATIYGSLFRGYEFG